MGKAIGGTLYDPLLTHACLLNVLLRHLTVDLLRVYTSGHPTPLYYAVTGGSSRVEVGFSGPTFYYTFFKFNDTWGKSESR